MKKCQDCKKSYEPLYINGIISSRRCDKCLRKWERLKKKKAFERAKIRKVKKREKRKNTNSYWGKKCWTLFAKQLKEKEVTFQGYVDCYTCPKKILVKESQAGHCFHRGRGGWRKIDFDLGHIHIQCQGCNGFDGGAIPKFTANLIRDYGWFHYKQIEKGAYEAPMTVPELKELFKKLSA